MKALVCELCGSNEFVKEDGYFVCQHCHTKYSSEEAKKIMVEGTVDVSGTVKIDSDSKIENLYRLARRAKDESNTENAAKYFSEILLERPNDWEAQFFSTYYEAYSCKIEEIGNASNKVANSITSVFELIRDGVAEEERITIFRDIKTRINALGSVLYSKAITNALQSRAPSFEACKVNVTGILSMYYKLAMELEKEGDGADAADLYKKCINLSNLKNITIYSSSEKQEILDKIKKYDSNYSAPAEVKQGCYIATVVYGTYDCPEVWTLRRFRDNTLAETWYGRTFIHTYYAISPTLVKWFGKTDWFKKLWKPMLDRMVGDLQSKGVENTPYEDRKW